jgi:hypothetical protein
VVGGAQTPARLLRPPVVPLAAATVILVVLAGILVVSYFPTRAPLAPSVALIVVAAGLLAINIAVLSRLREFAWGTFFLVGKWSLLGYAIIAGMLELVFVLDRMPVDLLLLLTASLLIYAVDIPLLLAYSVAQYQTPARRDSSSLPA